MKLKNLIIILLIGAGTVYGGLKGYIYYKVKKQADILIASASPLVEIEYGSIGFDVYGPSEYRRYYRPATRHQRFSPY